MIALTTIFLETGVKSPKIIGCENFEFSGVPEFDPFLQRFSRKASIWGSKVQTFQGQLSGRVPPPLERSVLFDPPIPVSEIMLDSPHDPHPQSKRRPRAFPFLSQETCGSLISPRQLPPMQAPLTCKPELTYPLLGQLAPDLRWAKSRDTESQNR